MQHAVTRIYVWQHTPQKGIRLILDTVSRMRGWATQFNTSQLGGVTNAVSHVTASLFSQPPRSATSTHHNHQQLAMSTHHLDRRLTTKPTHHHNRQRPTAGIDQWLQPPTTTIDKQPQGPIGTSFDKRPLAPPSTNGHGCPRRSTNGKSPCLLSVHGVKGSVSGRGHRA